MAQNSKEMRCAVELGSVPFSLYYFKPPSFKNMNLNAISEIKLIAHTLCSIYTIDDKSILFSNSSIGYVERKILEILELSKRSGCRVLILNAPFNSIGVFVFGKRFSMINSVFGGQSDGYYSIAFTKIQKLAKEAEKKLAEEESKDDPPRT